MKILGIDLGSNLVGFALIEKKSKIELLEAGFIKIDSSSFNEGLILLNQGLQKILEMDIDEVVIEDIFFAFSPKTVLKLAQYRGAICVKVLERFENFYQYTPLQVKKQLQEKQKLQKNKLHLW